MDCETTKGKGNHRKTFSSLSFLNCILVNQQKSQNKAHSFILCYINPFPDGRIIAVVENCFDMNWHQTENGIMLQYKEQQYHFNYDKKREQQGSKKKK